MKIFILWSLFIVFAVSCFHKERTLNPIYSNTELNKNNQLGITLDRLHKESEGEIFTILKGLSKGIFRKLEPKDMKEAYIAMSREQGIMMYELILESKSKNIIEFGTSFGISTLYLAAGAKENGGKVITTELLKEKADIAKKNFHEAGLEKYIELREGDAMITLHETPNNIEFLLLDGWNDLYLPLLKMLEPKFKNGCIIVTDNVNFSSANDFLGYVRNNKNYKSTFLDPNNNRTEKSVWTKQE